jgi:hypothetical protein
MKDLQEIRFDKETSEKLDTMIDLLRLILEQQYVETKMKIHQQERKRLIEEGVLDENI